MPVYEYECAACGHTSEEFQFMQDDRLTQCPGCLDETYVKQVSMPHTDMKAFRKPIEMYSVALDTPQEIADFKRSCPDIECDANLNNELGGIPVAHNRKEKKQIMEAMGVVERK